jgi:hypothetical protein
MHNGWYDILSLIGCSIQKLKDILYWLYGDINIWKTHNCKQERGIDEFEASQATSFVIWSHNNNNNKYAVCHTICPLIS